MHKSIKSLLQCSLNYKEKTYTSCWDANDLLQVGRVQPDTRVKDRFEFRKYSQAQSGGAAVTSSQSILFGILTLHAPPSRYTVIRH